MSLLRRFRRGPRPDDYVLLRNTCWSDPALDALAAVIRNSSAPAEERVARMIAHLADVRHDPDRRVCAVVALDDDLVECLDAVRAAAARHTTDRSADADARALLAGTLVAAAWQVRGGGQASTVSARAFETFHEILAEADEVGYQALELDPANPIAGCARLDSARGLGVPDDEWWARFEVGRRAKPTLYRAHTAMLQALCLKWYGSHDLMFDFARRAAAEAPVGDPIGALLAIAHVEYLIEEDELAVPAEDLELARYAADRWIAGGEAAMAAHPDAPAAHQLFGWLLRGDKDRRRFHLSRSMGRMSFLPWEYLEDPEGAYREQLALAQVTF